MERSFLKKKTATNQMRKVVDINTLLQTWMPKIVCSQQVRDKLGLQKEYQSEDQTNAEDDENGYIAESESMLQSYCSRENYNSQTALRQADSWQPLNDESPVSEESTSVNPKLLQFLISQVQSDPCLWDKACPE